MAKEIGVGDVIPEFTLPNENNEMVTVSKSDQEKRVIYFYPKDDTKVCTAQACSFRDWQSELNALEAHKQGLPEFKSFNDYKAFLEHVHAELKKSARERAWDAKDLNSDGLGGESAINRLLAWKASSIQ